MVLQNINCKRVYQNFVFLYFIYNNKRVKMMKIIICLLLLHLTFNQQSIIVEGQPTIDQTKPNQPTQPKEEPAPEQQQPNVEDLLKMMNNMQPNQQNKNDGQPDLSQLASLIGQMGDMGGEQGNGDNEGEGYEDGYQPMPQEQNYIDDYQDKVHEWILEQENKNSQVDSLSVEESFNFLIEQRGQKIFKWDPSKQKNLSLEIYVYFLTDVGEIAIPESNSRQQCVQVFTKKHEKSTYYHHDYIYVHSIISINFDTDYRILRFTNNYDKNVLLSVDLEFPGNIIRKGLDDDDLVENQKKMNSIIKQIELTETKREHGHKIEKGFFKHENSHEQVLLVLTGVQLIAILFAAFVQVAWIKSLIENKQII